MGKKFKNANDSVRPTNFVDYKTYLLNLYQHLKAKDRAYTYQKLAEDLGFAPSGIINQVVNGRRKLTRKFATKIAQSLKLDGKESKYLDALVEYTHSTDPGKRDELFNTLLEIKKDKLENREDKLIMQFFSDWYHPVVLELVGTKEFKNDSSIIAKSLIPPIRPAQAEKSINLLMELDLIGDEDGNIVVKRDSIRTPPIVHNLALSSFHHKMIGLAQSALSTAEGNERNVTGITVKLTEKQFAKLKKEITDYQLKILDEIEKEDATGERVFQLNTQLFPVTK